MKLIRVFSFFSIAKETVDWLLEKTRKEKMKNVYFRDESNSYKLCYILDF